MSRLRIPGDGDANVAVRSTVKVRKIRADQVFVRTTSGQLEAQQKHHDWELMVKLTRARRVGDRDPCN